MRAATRLAPALLALAAGAAGAGSPLDPVSPLETRVWGEAEWLAQGRAALRIEVRDARRGRPLPAEVGVELVPPPERARRGERPLALWHGRTNELGTGDWSARLPPLAPGPWRLVVRVDSPLGSDRIERPISIVYAATARIALDRPRYSPGDRLRGRVLVLQRPHLRPAPGLPVPVEILDPNGVARLDRSIESSQWGVAAFELDIDDAAPPGRWLVRVRLPHATSERAFEVLPARRGALDVAVVPDATWVTADSIAGEVIARDRLGLPARDARARIEIERAGSRLARADLELDARGRGRFHLAVPTAAGGAGEPGPARLFARVIERSGRDGEAATTLHLGGSPLRLACLWPDGHPVRGAPARLLVRVSRPDGAPVARARVWVAGEPTAVEGESDESGLAELVVPVARDGLEVRAEHGPHAAAEPVAAPGPGDGSPLQLRVEPLLVVSGDSIRAHASGAPPGSPVYFDFLAEGRTALVKAAPAGAHGAGVTVAAPADLAGLLEVRAWSPAATGPERAARRRVLVVPPADLEVELSADRFAYRPGATARIDVAARDRRGVPALAALALTGGDEAGAPAGAGLALVERLAVAVGRDLDPQDAALLLAASAAGRDRALAWVLARLPPPPAVPELRASSLDERLAAARARWMRSIEGDAERIQGALLSPRWTSRRERPASAENTLRLLVRLGLVASREILDPWGRPYRAELVQGRLVALESAGADGERGTRDDVRWPGAQGTAPEPAPARQPAPGTAAPAGEPADGGGTPPFAWLPEVLTGETGRATLEVELPRRAGSWRITALASSRPGGLGGGELAILTESPWAVLDAPEWLAPGERSEVAVVFHPAGDGPPRLRVAVRAAGAVALDGAAPQQEVAPGAAEPFRVAFPIRAAGPGAGEVRIEFEGEPGIGPLAATIPVRPPLPPDGASDWLSLDREQCLTGPGIATLRFFASLEAVAAEALAVHDGERWPPAARAAGIGGLARRLPGEDGRARAWLSRLAGEAMGSDGHGDLAATALAVLALDPEDPRVSAGLLDRLRGRLEVGARDGERQADPPTIRALAAWALAHAGHAPPGRATELAAAARDASDAWTAAAATRALLLLPGARREAERLAGRLLALRGASGLWPGPPATPTGARGVAAAVETSALAAAALAEAGNLPAAASALAVLSTRLDRARTWGSPWTAVWLLEVARRTGVRPAATIALRRGTTGGEGLDLSPGDGRQPRELAVALPAPGEPPLSVGPAPGAVLEVVRQPHPDAATAPEYGETPVEVRLAPRGGRAEAGRRLTLELRLRSRDGRDRERLAVEVPLAPGADLATAELDAALAAGRIEAWWRQGRTLGLLIAHLERDRPWTLDVPLVPRLAYRGALAPARAWEADDPGSRWASPPVPLEIRDRGRRR